MAFMRQMAVGQFNSSHLIYGRFSLQSRFATTLSRFATHIKFVSLQILSRFATLIQVIYCLCFVLYIILINILSVLKRPGSELGTLGN